MPTNNQMNPNEIIQQGLGGLFNPVEAESLMNQMNQVSNSAYDYVEGATIFIEILKWAGVIATFILLLLFIWLFFKAQSETKQKLSKLIGMLNPPTHSKSAFQERWDEVLRHLSSFREGEWKFAIIEADKLVDNVLKEAGFEGETLGEKLKNINTSQLNSINELWNAHKLRNLVVHDPTFKAKHIEVKQAIGVYSKVLKELGILN